MNIGMMIIIEKKLNFRWHWLGVVLWWKLLLWLLLGTWIWWLWCVDEDYDVDADYYDGLYYYEYEEYNYEGEDEDYYDDAEYYYDQYCFYVDEAGYYYDWIWTWVINMNVIEREKKKKILFFKKKNSLIH